MSYLLLTGATGLLGRYLLRDLLLVDQPVAVVVRSSRRESARQRIEAVLLRFEEEMQRALPRPVILEGELTLPFLGLSAEEIAWVERQVDTIVHSAAKLTFQAESPEGEPYRTNVEGTRNVLELCRRTNIRHMHHVSTAYVCGLRTGLVREDELDVGQKLGNDYEKSKLTSEQEVRRETSFESITVHRPAIIVGDSKTGYTNTFHGFYSPLRFIHSVLGGIPAEEVLGVDYLGMLGLNGSERKNIVPVDWVSAVMTRIIRQPALHGKTYNLTSLAPATVTNMRLSCEAALIDYVHNSTAKFSQSFGQHDYEAAFNEQMQVYSSYWRDDPTFDCRNTLSAAPDLPCPYVDDAMMVMLAKFALKVNFGWPCEQTPVIQHDIHAWLAPLVEAGKSQIPAEENSFGLQVTGCGGGSWQIALDVDQPVAAWPGSASAGSPLLQMNSTTFSQLATGQLDPTEALRTGCIAVLGENWPSSKLASVLPGLISPYNVDLALSGSR